MNKLGSSSEVGPESEQKNCERYYGTYIDLGLEHVANHWSIVLCNQEGGRF